MAFNIKIIYKSIGLYVLILLGVPTIGTSNIDCGKKPFHCVNSTHFMICVDLGGGVSRTIDNYVFECPSPTECQPSNSFECEFPKMTTLPSRVSEVTNELNTTLLSEDTIVTISSLTNETNTNQVTQPEAILTIDVTSTATTNSYTATNDQNITDNASNSTIGSITNFTPGNIGEKTDVSNIDITTNVFESFTLPTDSVSSSTNMITDNNTSTSFNVIPPENMVNGSSSTKNILGRENVTETTEYINLTDQVTSSTFLKINETNSTTDSLTVDIVSSITSTDQSSTPTMDTSPKENINKSVDFGDALELANKTENVFSTESETLLNTSVTLPSATATTERITTTLEITKSTAITVSTDTSPTVNQTEYESGATPILNNSTEINTVVTADGWTLKDVYTGGVTGAVEISTVPTNSDIKNDVTASVGPTNLSTDPVTSNHSNAIKEEITQVTDASTVSTDQSGSSTTDYQLEVTTNKYDMSNNVTNNKTVSTIDEQRKDNVTKSDVSNNTLEIENITENELLTGPESVLSHVSVTYPSVAVSNEGTIITNVATEATAVTTSADSASQIFNQNQSETSATAITNNSSEYYFTTEKMILTSKKGVTGTIETTTDSLIADMKNDETASVEPTNLPIDPVTSHHGNATKEEITQIIDASTVSTDQSGSSTTDYQLEVTTNKYDMSNNVTNNKTVSTIDEQRKDNVTKSDVSNNTLEIENITENELLTGPEIVLSQVSITYPSVAVSSEGTIITTVATEATAVTTSADSASQIFNQNESESSATAIINNSSENYFTTETTILTSKKGATGTIETTTDSLIADMKNDVTASVGPTNLPIDPVTSHHGNATKEEITQVTDASTVSTDQSESSTTDYQLEVTTNNYDMSNNVTNNKTVSTIDEQRKDNVTKSDVSNNTLEIENITENELLTGPESVLSHVSVTYPSVAVSNEGTIITTVATEATAVTTSADSASQIFNQNESESNATAITNNSSEHYFTTETTILTSKKGATGTIETTTDSLIADMKNDVTASVGATNLPIDPVTSHHGNATKEEITQVTDASTVSTDQSGSSTTDYQLEVTTNNYDMSNNVTNNKIVSTIDEQRKDNVTKSDVSNNTLEIENITENELLTGSESVLSHVSGTYPSVAVSNEGTIITTVATEATAVTTSADSASQIFNQNESESSATAITNNSSEHYFATETTILTSKKGATGTIETTTDSLIADMKNDVTASVEPTNLPIDPVTSNHGNATKEEITQVTDASTVSTDQSGSSTTDYQLEVTTNNYDMSNNVTNNKTVSTIDEQRKDNVTKSDVSNNTLEIENITENELLTGPESVLSHVSITYPSVAVSSEGTIITTVATEATAVTTSADSASQIFNQNESESSATAITSNSSEHYFATETTILTSKKGATGTIETTTDSLLAVMKNDVTASVEPTNLPIDPVTSHHGSATKEEITQVTNASTVSTDQSGSSTTDYQLEFTTNKYDMSNNVTNNKTVSTIDEQRKDNVTKSDVSNNTLEIENITENELLTGPESVLSHVSITYPSVAVSSEGTIITTVATEATAVTTSADSASQIFNQNESESSATAITSNSSEHYFATETTILTSKKGATGTIETTTDSLLADMKNDVTASVEPTNLPIDPVTSHHGSATKEEITQVTNASTVSTDQSGSSTTDYQLEVTTNKYDMSNNVTNNKTVSTIDEQRKDNVNKSDVSNNTLEIENITENELLTGPESVLTQVSTTYPSVAVSSEGTIITNVATEATALTTSADSASQIFYQNESESSATAITNNSSEQYFTTETTILTSKKGATGTIETTTDSLLADMKNDETASVEPTNLPIDPVTSHHGNATKEEITQVTDASTVSTDQSGSSTTEYQLEVTTNKYDMSNNVTNNKTVSTIDEQRKDNVTKSDVSNNTLEIENITENELLTGPESVLSHVSITYPSVAVSSEGTIITTVATEATAVTTSAYSASQIFNQNESESSATAITNNSSEHYFTTETTILTSKKGATGTIETTTDSLIADMKNDVTASVEPTNLPIDPVTSHHGNATKEEITQVTDASTVSTDQSGSSTTDYQLEVTTNKYDMSNNVTNSKTVSTIDEQPKDNVNKSDVSNTLEIENIIENELLTGPESVLSHVSITHPSVAVSSEGTIITTVATEATAVTTSADSASQIFNQNESESSATATTNNSLEHYFTTETTILTSKEEATGTIETTTASLIADIKNDVTASVGPTNLPIEPVTSHHGNAIKEEITQVTDASTVSTDQSESSTTDYQLEVTTNKYDMSNNVINNNTVFTIDEQPKDNVNKSDVSNNALEIENITKNGSITESGTASFNISISLPSASNEVTATTLVITDGAAITNSTDENLATIIDKTTEENTSGTDISDNISLTNFTIESVTSTTQSVNAGLIESIATKGESAFIEPINKSTASVTLNVVNVNKDATITVTEATTVSTDQRSTFDSQFQVSTNKYDTPIIINNKTVSTIEEKPKDNVNKSSVTNSAVDNENKTENSLPPPVPEVDLPVIPVTLSPVEVSRESTIPTVITKEISVTAITKNTLESNSTIDGITLTTKTNNYKTTTSSINLNAENETSIVEPIALPIDLVTSKNVNKDMVTQVTDFTKFTTDQSPRSTLDYEFELNTNKYNTTKNVINNNIKTETTIDEKSKGDVNISDTRNNALEIENIIENSLLTRSEAATSNIPTTSTSGAASSETITTVVITKVTEIPISTENNLAFTISEHPAYNKIVTDIFNNISVTNFTKENMNSTPQRVTAGPTETMVTLPTVPVTPNYVNVSQDMIIPVTEAKEISNDQTTTPTFDYQFEASTNKYDIPYEANNEKENNTSPAVREPALFNPVHIDEANGNVPKNPTGLPPNSVTLPSFVASSKGIISSNAARDDTEVTSMFTTTEKVISTTTFNNNNTNIQVTNKTNWNSNSNINLSNSTVPLAEVSSQNQKSKKTHQHRNDNRESNNKKTEVKFNCNHHRRGRYADQDNCRIFYICIGRLSPIVGECPANTVFSEHTKQCTKNLSHCVRGNQFHCETSGRFSDLTQQSVYYICVKNKLDSYVRFTFQCQSGYILDKETVRCIENEPERSTSNDNDSESEKSRDKSDFKNERPSKRKNDERDSGEERSESKEFECEEEGKFAHPDNCRQYYKCSKNKKSQFRRRIKSCDSDELFDENKKKCVDAESYECQRK